MNKRLMFIIVVLVLIGSAVLYVLQLTNSPRGLQLFPYAPTPTPVQPPGDQVKSTIRLESIEPRDNQDNVPVTQVIQATFNQSAQNISFAIYPDIPFTINATNRQTMVTFSESLASNTTYSYSFLDADGKIVTAGKFSTGPTAESIAPLSKSYDNLDTTANKAQQENYPDVFLATYTPYDATTFSVSSDFSNSGSNHFIFTVVQKSASGKKDFLSWLESLGMTTFEMQKLDIHYQ